MIKLAESSGTIVYEDMNKLFINKKPSQWTSTFLFVTALLAFILLSNGILQLFILHNKSGINSKVGWILVALGFLFLFLFWQIKLYQRKINSLTFDTLKLICMLDFNSNNLFDAQGNILTSLQNVLLSKRMQISSSSPALELRWSKESLTIVYGNPFSGGVSAVERILISRGINKK